MLSDPRPFNFAALNNMAVSSLSADVLVFLNNDTAVINRDWLAVMLESVRPDVGAVAPLLFYPDGAVQHAGAAIGLHGYAGHPFAGLSPDAATPFGRAIAGTRNWLAVTAACMMVERFKFVEVGSFDEGFVVGGNDVDLCLRLTAAGYRSLCVPRTALLHDESRSRGRTSIRATSLPPSVVTASSERSAIRLQPQPDTDGDRLLSPGTGRGHAMNQPSGTMTRFGKVRRRYVWNIVKQGPTEVGYAYFRARRRRKNIPDDEPVLSESDRLVLSGAFDANDELLDANAALIARYRSAGEHEITSVVWFLPFFTTCTSEARTHCCASPSTSPACTA